MAKYQMELPDEILKDFNYMIKNAPDVFEQMTRAGAMVVYENVVNNMRRSFKDSENLVPFLKVTRPYRTYGGKYVNTKVGFYGYYKPESRTYTFRRGATSGHEYKSGKKYKITKTSGRSEAEYTYNGVPVPLIVIAREYGTSSGEKKKPFFRKSFKKTEIEQAMLRAQKYATGGLLDDK